jgi:hypothetical protein
MNRYSITIKPNAGAERENGHPDPIVRSRGRVFFVYSETVDDARVKFCAEKIPARDTLPETSVYPEDFEIVEAPFENEKTTTEENWTKGRPG